jgi:hypothetical protein
LKCTLKEFNIRPNQSYSDWIEKRATKQGREEFIHRNIQAGFRKELFEEELKSHGKTNIDELSKPYVLIIRK